MKNRKPDVQHSLALSLDRIEDDVYHMSVSSDAPVMRFGEPEILSHDSESVILSDFMNVGAILRNHDPNQIIGKPVSAKVVDGVLRVGFKFGETEQALNAKAEVDQGLLRGVSVGGRVEQNDWFYFKSDGEYKGKKYNKGTWLATRWSVREASLTPIPADTSVGVNRTESEREEMKRKIKMKKDYSLDGVVYKADEIYEVTPEVFRSLEDVAELHNEMATKPTVEQKPVARAETLDVSRDMVQDTIKRELEKERERVESCFKIARDYGISQDSAGEIVRSGGTVEDMKALALETLRTQNDALSRTSGSVKVTQDSSTSFVRAAIDSLIVRNDSNAIDEKVARDSGAYDLAGMSLVRLAEECLRRSGRKVPSHQADIVREAMRGSEPISFARHSEDITVGTPDFPYILANVANKEMLRGAGIVPTTYQQWCSIGNAKDFKAMSRLKLSEAGELKEVPEFGEYQMTRFSESQETIQIATYGRAFNLSRKAIINDDLSAFTRIPFAMGYRAASKPNELAVAILLGNGTMSDGNALFSTDHSNYSASSSYKLDTAEHARNGISNLYTKFMQAKSYMNVDTDEIDLGLALSPYVILVPPTGSLIAQTALGMTQTGTTSNIDYNPVKGLAPIVTERLLENANITGYSTTGYYMFADPRISPVIEVAFLNGVQTPFMEQVDNVGTAADGMVFKVRMDVGGAIVDWRGAFKENGA